MKKTFLANGGYTCLNVLPNYYVHILKFSETLPQNTTLTQLSPSVLAYFQKYFKG